MEQLQVINDGYHAVDSRTTRHLNKWLQRFAGWEIKPVPQATLDQIHHRANLWEAQQAGVL